MRALRYFLNEAAGSLRRGYRTVIVAVTTIAAALFVLGCVLVVTSNMERLFARWQEAAEMSLYLRDDATGPQQSGIQSALKGSPLVAGVEMVSKEEALRRFKRNFGELAAAADDLPENPLPASVEVRLVPHADAADLEALAARASKMDGVADVRYDRRWLQRLMGAAAFVRAGGFGLVVVLILAAALTVASVVRLALLARREEIHIMQLVGAPLTYIRGPFVVEGLIQGGLGAVIAVAVLWALFNSVRAREMPALAGAIDPASVAFLSVPMCLALVVGGMAVGCVGGLIAALSTREIAD